MNAYRIAIVLVVCLAGAAPARAQSPAPSATGRLLVTVADPSGAIIPNARVVVTPEDGAAAAAIEPAQTTAAGIATIDRLAPGRYTIAAEFPGFETVTMRGIRVRSGETKRTVTLPLRKVAEDVTVGRDAQTSALDPRGMAFSTVLTREQIAMLPDDPEELEAVLKAMAPPGAVLRVDGFTGGRLPPKSQIRSIRLPRMDMLAAQNHGSLMGMMHVDIMTQPGSGPLRGSVDVAFRDDALNARNPFTPAKGAEGLRQGGFSLAGAIVPDRSSFSITAQQARVFDTGNLLAAMPDGTLAEPVRRPTDRQMFNARFDQALGPAHLLRASYQRSTADARNLGVGGFDLFDRAFSTSSREHLLRISENGPVGRRFFWESRAQLRWTDNETQSAIEAPAVRVLDAFTAGGAQQRGGTHGLDLEAASDLDYVRGVHSFRTGVLLEAGRYRSDQAANYLGTYTFASLADYEAGRPANYARRIGDPAIRYSNLQLGVYAQDDYRAHRSLMISYGVRYEVQSLVSDHNNLSPRLSLTWAPLKSGKTTFRGGVGYFSDWMGTSTWEQGLRFDGEKQREINVLDPQWPADEADAALLPTNKYLLPRDVDLPAALMGNLGVEQMFSPSFRVNATYTFRRGYGLLRGRNLNAPVAGVRPDARFSNVVEVVGDAESRLHQFGVSAMLMLMNRRNTFLAANYNVSSSDTNTTGAFAIPANGDDLSTEWGPAVPRHRASLTFNTRPFANLALSLNLRAQSGSPYNVTIGADRNGDGLFNDRPVDTPRNSATTAGQFDAGLRLSYTIGFGQRPAGTTGGQTMIMIGGGGGGMPGGVGSGAANSRFRLEIYAAAQNVTNRRNFVGYSGVLTSPFFGQPTNVMNPRKIEVGMRFGF